MAGYRTPSGDGLGPLIDELRDIRRRLSELEIPTGTSMNSLVAQVQAALANIEATVIAAIEANSYTKTQIDAKVASPGAIAPTTVTATGVGTFNAGLKSTDVYSHSVTYGGPYTATWTHQDGTMGTAPSSERFKQDIEPAVLDLTSLERAQVVHFKYRDAVANLGEDAEVRLGGIAEQFVAAGLDYAVTFDEDGLPFTIEDRPIVYALLAAYQSLAARVARLEGS
jgi:hypothetical protein